MPIGQPTLSTYGLIAFALLLVIVGVFVVLRKRATTA